MRSGRWRGRPTLPGTGAMPSTSGSSWVTSLRFPPVSATARGRPAASTSRWCLEPMRARSTREGPVSPPSKSPDVARVHYPARPVDPAGGVQAAEELAVQPLPHPCALPLPEPSPSGHPGAADLPRDHPPRHPTHQHEHDRRERCAVTDSGAPRPLRGAIRQQRLDQLPQPIIDELRSRHGPPPGSPSSQVFCPQPPWGAAGQWLLAALGFGSRASALLRRLERRWTQDLYGVGVALSSCPQATKVGPTRVRFGGGRLPCIPVE